MIDKDGKYTYSPIVFVETPATALNMSIPIQPPSGNLCCRYRLIHPPLKMAN